MFKFIFFLVLVFSSVAFSADHAADHSMIKPQDIQWVDGPASLPKGAQMAILFGNPKEAEPFCMRLKMPAKYVIPPHFHPADENVTVISGTFSMGVGHDVNSLMMALPEGSFARMKAGTHHFARAEEEETIVQINGIGPWGITYVNP